MGEDLEGGEGGRGSWGVRDDVDGLADGDGRSALVVDAGGGDVEGDNCRLAVGGKPELGGAVGRSPGDVNGGGTNCGDGTGP